MSDLIERPPEPEIISPSEGLRVHAANHPIRIDEAVDLVLPAGMTVREILEASQPDPYLRRFASIRIDDEWIDPADWDRRRPPPGARVYIRILPADSDTGGIISAALGAIIIIVGVFTANPALIAAGIGILGSGIVSLALQPDLSQISDDDESSPQLQITGARNEVREFQPYPRLFGTVRVFPAFHPNALPFTIIEGDDQFLVLLFIWGYGPLTLPEAERIGQTALEEFSDFDVEHIQGFPPSPRTFAPADVNTTLDTITIAGHPYVDDNILKFTTDGTLPAPLVAGTEYWVLNVAEMRRGMSIAAVSIGDDPIVLTSQGTGTHTATRFERPITIYSNTVIQDQFSVALTNAAGWVTRTTEPDTDEISIDIEFPQGLIRFKDDGERLEQQVNLDSQFAPSPGVSRTFIAGDVDTINDEIDITGHPYTVDQIVDFSTTDTLPAPLQLNTDYYIVNPLTNSFQVSLSKGGAPVDLTDGGIGTHTITQHDWSSDATGIPFGIRLSQSFPRLRTETINYREGWRVVSTIQQHRIYINLTTGELLVRSGKVGQNAVISTNGSVPRRFELRKKTTPRTPFGYVALAEIRWTSDNTTIGPAQLTDLRDPDGPYGSPSDFLVVPTSPASKRVEIGAGSIVFLGLEVKAKTQSLLRRNINFRPQTPGTYDVRVRRTTGDTVDPQKFNKSFWTNLKSIKYEDPIPTAGMAKTAMKIRATDQLSGIVDEYSAIMTSILQDWDGTDWVYRPTNNPAAARRELLQGVANARPVKDVRIDFPSIEDWHDYCSTQGWEFNLHVDFKTTVRDLLDLANAAGQAGEARPGGKRGIVIEERLAAHTGLYSERNSFGFRGTKNNREIPDGIRARFVNEEEDYRQSSRLVFRDGFDESNANLIQATQIVGTTNPDLIWRRMRLLLAELELRPETYVWSTDFEGFVNTRGDWVKKQNDSFVAGNTSTGRIKAVQVDGGGNATSADLDDTVTMEVAKTYSLGIRTLTDVTYFASVVNNPGKQTSVSFSPVIPVANVPAPGDLWVFGETVAGDPLDVLILSVEAKNNLEFTFTGTALAPEIFDVDVLDQTFDPGNVNTTTERITITAHKLVEGALVEIFSDNTLPGGLVPDTTAFSPTDVDASADTITLTGTALVNDQVVLVTTDDLLPGGLIFAKKYYVVNKSGDAIQLSKSRGGIPINITDQGSGNHELTAYHVVRNPTTDDFQVSKTSDGPIVDLTSSGVGNHTISVAVPPYDPRILSPAQVPLPVPVIANDASTGQPSIRSDGTVLLRDTDGSLRTRILIKLDQPPGLTSQIDSVECEIKISGTDDQFIPCGRANDQATEVSIIDVEDGITYDFRLRYRSPVPQRSSAWSAAFTHLVVGKTAPPADVTGFTIQQNNNVVTFAWNQVPDLDLAGYDIRFGAAGIAWESATPVTQVTRGTKITTAVVPPGTFDFLIKAVDTSGNESLNAAIISDFTVTAPFDLLFENEQFPVWSNLPPVPPQGSTAPDDSPTNNPMTLKNGATYLRGGLGRSYLAAVNQTAAPLADAPDDPAYDTGPTLLESYGTLEFRFRINDVGTQTADRILCKKSPNKTDNDAMWVIWIEANTGELHWSWGRNVISAFDWNFITNGAVDQDFYTDGEWHHLALVRSQSSFLPYINGIFTITSAGSGNLALSNTDPFELFNDNGIECDFDEVRLWSTARTQVEIQNNMNSELTLPQTGLVGYWRMNEFQDAPFVRNPLTGHLNTNSNTLASADAAQDVFDNYVIDPVESGTYEAPEFDIGFDDQVTVYGPVDAALGPGEPGIANPLLEVDYRENAGSYDGFESWTIGSVHAQFIKHRFTINTDPAQQGGAVVVRGFRPIVDIEQFTQSEVIEITQTGTVVVFPRPFHAVPRIGVDAEAVGGAARYGTWESVTTTQFVLRIFNSAGVEQSSGRAKYDAFGG